MTRTRRRRAAHRELRRLGRRHRASSSTSSGACAACREAALRQYFATEEARRAAQLSLIAEVANAWLTLAADRELLRVSQADARLAGGQLRPRAEALRAGRGLAPRLRAGAHHRRERARGHRPLRRPGGARHQRAAAAGGRARSTARTLPTGFAHATGRGPAGGPRRPALGSAAAPPRRAPGRGSCCARPTPTSAPRARRSSRRSRSPAAWAPRADELSGLFGGGSFAWSFIPR